MQSRATTQAALAPTLWTGNRAVQNVVLVLIGTAILAISAKVQVPFWPVPMTLQTLAVMLIGATYGSRVAVATVLAYIAEGALGLPVFANTPPQIAGPAYLIGPTAGYIWGWVAAAAIIGYAADKGWSRSVPKMFAAMLAGEIVLFGMGFVWLAWFATLSSGAVGMGAEKALAAGVTPFLLADALKLTLAALAVPAAWRLLANRE
jgi:biotin transport system substrate-specific component